MSDAIHPGTPENAGLRLAHAVQQLSTQAGVEFDAIVTWLTGEGGLATMALAHFTGVTEEQRLISHLRQHIDLPEGATMRQAMQAVRQIAEAYAQPVDAVLHCPSCKRQHIDAWESYSWRNPPHRTHRCAGCGAHWTPSDRNTNGVVAVKPGSSANWPVPSLDLFAIERLPMRDEMGFTYHPDIPEGDDEKPITPHLWAIGWDGKFVSAESDMSIEAYDKAVDSMNFLDWTPSRPEGDGWKLAAIYDTEDGPYALFVKPFPHQPAQPRQADDMPLETSEADARPANV